MPIEALADEVTTNPSFTDFVSNAITVFSKCWNAMTSNPVVGILVGLSLLGTGAGLFARFKSAV